MTDPKQVACRLMGFTCKDCLHFYFRGGDQGRCGFEQETFKGEANNMVGIYELTCPHFSQHPSPLLVWTGSKDDPE